MKECNKCHQVKDLDQFRKHRGSCLECERQYSRERYPVSKDRVKKWRQSNMTLERKVLYNETSRKGYARRKANTPPSSRIYIKTCPITNQIFVSSNGNRAYSREGLIIAKRLAYQRGNHKSFNKRFKLRECPNCGVEHNRSDNGWTNLYCSKKCEKHVQRQKDTLRHRGIPGPPLTTVRRTLIFERYNYTCPECGILCNGDAGQPTEPTIDHITPVSKGGTNYDYNLRLLCRLCNVLKGDKILFI